MRRLRFHYHTTIHNTTSQPRKGDVTGCQFGALGACPVVLGGCPHPTGWWRHPNHRQLHQEVLGTRDPTTARDVNIRCLRGVCAARCRSPPHHPCAPAPRSIAPRGRLVRRVVLRAAPGTPGPARRKPKLLRSTWASGGEPIPGKSRKKGGGVWGTHRGQNQLQRRFRAHIGAPQPGSEPGAPQSKRRSASPRLRTGQNFVGRPSARNHPP
jgi:hypothetical protein